MMKCVHKHTRMTHTHTLSAIDSRDVTHMKPDDGMDPDQQHLLQQQYHPPPPPPQRRPAAPKNAKGNAISFTHRLHEPFGMPFEGYGTAKGPADGRTFGRGGEYSFCTRQRIGHSGPRAGQDLELPSLLLLGPVIRPPFIYHQVVKYLCGKRVEANTVWAAAAPSYRSLVLLRLWLGGRGCPI